MHYVGLDHLETRRIRPPIPELRGLATPALDMAPGPAGRAAAGGAPHGGAAPSPGPARDLAFLAAARGLFVLERGGARPVALPDGFEPCLLVDCPRQELLVVDPLGDTLALGLDGSVRRRIALGSEIADAAADDFGVFVLRRSGHLDKFDFEGRQLVDDPQVRRVNAASQSREGILLLVPYDGSVWLNLEEHFDDEGEPGLRVDPAALFGAGRVSGDLLGDDGVIVLTEEGRIVALDVRGRTCEAKTDRKRVRKALGRDLTASADCLATRGDRLTVLSTDKGAITTFGVYAE